MTINHFLSTFAGLPVVAADDEKSPGDPGAVAWRIDMDYDSGAAAFTTAFGQLLDRVGPGGPTALIIGEWGEAHDTPFPVEVLIDNADRLGALRSLFIGEMSFEQCEISWIQQTDLTPILTTFPLLERLWVRGSQDLVFKKRIRHEGLRELVLQSGGLPAAVVENVGGWDVPNLRRLELWLGVDNYGGDATVDDLAPFLAGRSLPSLTSLGLRNSEIADQVAAAVAAAPVVARLTHLDLSMGTLGDAGAEALLAGQPLTHLHVLNLSHHFMSPELAERLVDELPDVAVDISDPQTEEEWGRYTAVSE
ncbi:STM4015 family protein [Actinoplanes sp. NPDC023936]|uniref:STM4015 family protein n=1 Tax=Actinoplanes sp. NPDC023936 TaxID=3154910 RepID=UPI0033EB3C22